MCWRPFLTASCTTVWSLRSAHWLPNKYSGAQKSCPETAPLDSPSQTGQQCPGTLRGCEQRTPHISDWQKTSPSSQRHVTHGSFSHTAPFSKVSPLSAMQPAWEKTPRFGDLLQSRIPTLAFESKFAKIPQWSESIDRLFETKRGVSLPISHLFILYSNTIKGVHEVVSFVAFLCPSRQHSTPMACKRLLRFIGFWRMLSAYNTRRTEIQQFRPHRLWCVCVCVGRGSQAF